MSKRVREKTTSPSPCREGKAGPMDHQRSFLLDHMKNYPQEFSTHLACPFPKHEPEKYEFIKAACTEGWGFKNIRLLMEHLRHDHSLDFGCMNCRKRFRDKRHAQDHREGCRETKKIATTTKPIWMNEIQNDKFLALNFNDTKVSPPTAWNMICEALWGTGNKARIPGMYHAPGFFYSCLIYCSPTIDLQLNRRFRRLQQLDGPTSTPGRQTSKRSARKPASNGSISKDPTSKGSLNTISDLLPDNGSMYANKPRAAVASRRPSTLTDSAYGTEGTNDAYVSPSQTRISATSEGAQIPSTLTSTYTSDEAQAQFPTQVKSLPEIAFAPIRQPRDATAAEQQLERYGVNNSGSGYQQDIPNDFPCTAQFLGDPYLPEMSGSIPPWIPTYQGFGPSGESIFPYGDNIYMDDEDFES